MDPGTVGQDAPHPDEGTVGLFQSPIGTGSLVHQSAGLIELHTRPGSVGQWSFVQSAGFELHTTGQPN